jgi:hypothetical protein
VTALCCLAYVLLDDVCYKFRVRVNAEIVDGWIGSNDVVDTGTAQLGE